MDPAGLDPRRHPCLRPGVPARQAALLRVVRRQRRGHRARGRDVQAVREARALAPDDCDPEPDPARHEAPGDHRQASDLPGDLARRRRPRGRRPHSVPGEQAGARHPPRRLPAGRPYVPEAPQGDARLDGQARPAAASCEAGPVRALRLGARRGRKRVEAVPVRDRPGPVRRARAAPRDRCTGPPVCDPGLDGCAEGQLAAERPLGGCTKGTLHFRAPRKPGTYRLYVFAAGHAARCVVVVG